MGTQKHFTLWNIFFLKYSMLILEILTSIVIQIET